MIHSAIMGSLERFSAVLIEHLGGMFPLWLSPVQIKILPVSEKHAEYAGSVYKKMKEANMRVELDASNESLGKRIRVAKIEKTPYLLVLGDKEVEAGTVTAERRDGPHLEALPLDVFIGLAEKEISEKIAW
jgi:threonyl-tRNA synthetase